ncbi:predicted protein [Histoplasma mississippiense (nom. inval.)]|uniref:predicted protein n=1 Tax=Ajellomyces capsulatus (strain NAm1 / WU24) TaxID=2059318 RepID=UPI000157CF42|nr:predicted protein [Histoplasma mississippiense (nom. inval.)]EDN10955.1 predicted protein [Histoplasma mississippiense (nom. inval.)]
MDFFSLFVTLLWYLPFLSTAVPVAEPVAEPEMHLEKRKSAQTCKIVNLNKGQYVNCRYGATTKAGNIFAFSRGDKLIFSCKKKGQCVKGNWGGNEAKEQRKEAKNCSTWDRVTLYGTTCYVNGYFTDNNCSSMLERFQDTQLDRYAYMNLVADAS